MNLETWFHGELEQCSRAKSLGLKREIDPYALELALRAAFEEIMRLRTVLKPFSDMAGELFSRNWNDSQVVTALDNPNDPHHVTAGDYFAVRRALEQSK